MASAALSALATALLRIAGRWLVEVLGKIATAETPQRMLTPQDRQKELLVRAAERIEGPTFTPREGGAVANAIQQVLADLNFDVPALWNLFRTNLG